MEELGKGKVSMDFGKGVIELTKSLSRMEAWLEIIARRQTQLLAMKEGKDLGERVPEMYEVFNESVQEIFKEHIESIFPGLRVPDLPTAKPDEPHQPQPE